MKKKKTHGPVGRCRSFVSTKQQEAPRLPIANHSAAMQRCDWSERRTTALRRGTRRLCMFLTRLCKASLVGKMQSAQDSLAGLRGLAKQSCALKEGKQLLSLIWPAPPKSL